MITLSVKNFRGIEHARLEWSGIALVCGPNGAGKTSLLEAARTAVSAQPVRATHIKEMQYLLRRGATHGFIELRVDGNGMHIALPEFERRGIGKGFAVASRIALGIDDPVTMDQRGLCEAVAGLIDTAPTDDDLAAAIAGGDLVDVRNQIRDHGWDGAYKLRRDGATMAKGHWRSITGENWGAQKGPRWREEDADRDGPALERAVAAAQAAHEAAMRRSGMAAADRERLQACAAALTDLAAQRKATEEEGARLKTLLTEVEGKLAAIPDQQSVACPHCGKPCRIVAHGGGGAVIEKADTAARSKADIKAAREDLAMLSGAKARIAADIADARSRWEGLNIRVMEAIRAKEQLAALDSPDTDTPAASVDEAVAALDLDAAKSALDAHRKACEALRVHAHIVNGERLAQILGPDGLRRTALQRALGRVSEMLATIEPGVSIDENFEFRLNGMPGWLLSDGESLIVRAAAAAMFARQPTPEWKGGPALVVIDRAECLDAQGRARLIRMLHKWQVSALIGLTASSREKMPQLPDGIGRSFWIESGTVTP